jgi:hypothetical protein
LSRKLPSSNVQTQKKNINWTGKGMKY